MRQNDRPGKSVTMRLVVKAGSVNDPAPDLGRAHFVEHMVFRGTEDYTTEEFKNTLRDLGVEFDPDANAYINYDETVFELTISTDPVENVSSALQLLSQMGHAALIEPEAVESEFDDSNLPTSQNSLEELDAVTVSSVRALARVLYDKEGRVEVVRAPTAHPDGNGQG